MKWLVPERQKLVQFLQGQLSPPPSRKTLRRVLEANLCRVNGSVERFGAAEVDRGAIVELAPAWDSLSRTHLHPLRPLFEDDSLLIVDKPAGWVCDEAQCRKALGPRRYLVHRLDKETTGVLVVAKTLKARAALMQQFADRRIEKNYLALVDGIPRDKQGVCQTFLAKIGSYEGQTIWASRSKGLYAETHWRCIASGSEASLLLCQPVTGRTHQIRVHLAELGMPILIDRQYSSKFRCRFFASRPLLHALRIRLTHPETGEPVDVNAPLPDDFALARESLIGRSGDARDV